MKAPRHPDLRPGEVLGCDRCGGKPLLDGSIDHRPPCTTTRPR